LPGLAGAEVIFQWIGVVEYILCYGGPAEHWVPLSVTRLASRKILIEQNIKKRTGPALCVLCGRDTEKEIDGLHKKGSTTCIVQYNTLHANSCTVEQLVGIRN
jgi:hypothetical protein